MVSVLTLQVFFIRGASQAFDEAYTCSVEAGTRRRWIWAGPRNRSSAIATIRWSSNKGTVLTSTCSSPIGFRMPYLVFVRATTNWRFGKSTVEIFENNENKMKTLRNFDIIKWSDWIIQFWRDKSSLFQMKLVFWKQRKAKKDEWKGNEIVVKLRKKVSCFYVTITGGWRGGGRGNQWSTDSTASRAASICRNRKHTCETEMMNFLLFKLYESVVQKNWWYFAKLLWKHWFIIFYAAYF